MKVREEFTISVGDHEIPFVKDYVGPRPVNTIPSKAFLIAKLLYMKLFVSCISAKLVRNRFGWSIQEVYHFPNMHGDCEYLEFGGGHNGLR